MREDQDYGAQDEDPNAPAQPVDAPEDTFGNGLNSLYQQYYQRDATAGELASHRGNQGGLSAIELMLKGSIPAPTVAAPQPKVAPKTPTGGGGSYGTLMPPAAPPKAPAPPVFSPPPIVEHAPPPEPVDPNAPPPPPTPEEDADAKRREEEQKKADTLYDHLMEKARQAAGVDRNDPTVRAQADTYSANLTRQGRQYLSEMAERKGPSGNLGAESRMMAEKNAQASATNEGQLLQHEMDTRRAEISQALTTGAQFLSAQQKMGLDKELATIDNAMKMYQAKQQESQFTRGQYQQNDQFGRTLDQNEDQFGRTLTQQEKLAAAAAAQSGGQFGAAQAQREREFAENLRQRAYEYDTDDEYRRSPYAQR
jgi:hypothetical protein